MYIREPITLTEQMLNNNSDSNKYKGLLNANFQDYMDSMTQSGELKIKSSLLKRRVTALASTAGMAAGVLGGPGGLAVGFAVGNAVGGYVGEVMSNKLYGRALADMSEIYHVAEMRHTQLATTLAFNRKMGEAVNTLRTNENKRLKDALQEMAV